MPACVSHVNWWHSMTSYIHIHNCSLVTTIQQLLVMWLAMGRVYCAIRYWDMLAVIISQDGTVYRNHPVHSRSSIPHHFNQALYFIKNVTCNIDMSGAIHTHTRFVCRLLHIKDPWNYKLPVEPTSTMQTIFKIHVCHPNEISSMQRGRTDSLTSRHCAPMYPVSERIWYWGCYFLSI